MVLFWFKYRFRPQSLAFVSNWSLIFQLCQIDTQPFNLVSKWSLPLSVGWKMLTRLTIWLKLWKKLTWHASSKKEKRIERSWYLLSFSFSVTLTLSLSLYKKLGLFRHIYFEGSLKNGRNSIQFCAVSHRCEIYN